MSDRSVIARRMEVMARATGTDPAEWTDCPHEPGKRWRIDARHIEFECGCAAVRARDIRCRVEPWEPVIFVGLPEQAVYAKVCDRHATMMAFRIGTGGVYKDFATWKAGRYRTLLRLAV